MNCCVNCINYAQCFASELSCEELRNIKDCIVQKRYLKGETVFVSGRPAMHVHMVLKGRVKLEHHNHHLPPPVVRLAREQEYFGLETLLNQRNYGVTAKAFEESVVCSIKKSCIDQYVCTNSKASKKMLNAVLEEKECVMKYSAMTHTDGLTRVAQVLLALGDKQGMVTELKDEIAQMTQLRRETVSRLLAQLKDLGIVEMLPRAVRIINMQELEKIAMT